MTQTAELLLRWAEGDPQALADLVQQDGGWIENHVRRRLGPLLRRRADTQDVVQNTLLEVLKCGPRFVCADRGHLRALLAKMVENVLRAQAAHDQAEKRDVRREVQPTVRRDSGSVLILDARSAAVTRPSLAAERSETRDWVRLALELLDPEDRNIVQWREQDELSFAEIAGRLGVAEDAARMRFNRALPKLARKLKALRAGNLDSVLGSDG